MKWYFAAPFADSASDRWLSAFVPPGPHTFQTIPAVYRHDRSRARTDSGGWKDYVSHGLEVHRQANLCSEPAGIITCFPQLPLVVGARGRFSRGRMPTLAWAFNIGTLPKGLRRKVAQVAFGNISRFVVHSRAEVAACSDWLQLDSSRFEYVPLQRAVLDSCIEEDENQPFLVALGSAGRDYRLFVEVLRDLKYKAIIVAGQHAVDGIDMPPNVVVRTGISIEECHSLLQRARICVTPIRNTTTASGQVTLLDAMMYSKAQVVTRSPGSVDYLEDEKQALLVDNGDFDGMKTAIERLWLDRILRRRLGFEARIRMINEFSDEAVGIHLGRILDEISSLQR